MNESPAHFPYSLPYDDAPVDISFVFADEKPAGKHGFLTIDKDRFVFEDGTPGRFWGTNFNSGANFPEHDYAERVARRLARFGQNIVRFHQMDAPWSNPNIFQFHKGKRLENTRRLDPDSMDRLDYLVHCLKREGIYVYMDMITYRRFRSGDGVPNAHRLSYSAKPYSIFDKRMIELQQEFNEQLWTHVNPYTGLAYKDDPAVVLTEITNESDLFSKRGVLNERLEPYYGDLCARYRTWTEQNGVTPQATIDFESDDGGMLDFLSSVQKEYYHQIYDHLRSIGVRIPVAGTNWTINAHLLACDAEMDFTDGHAYWWDFSRGDQRNFRNDPMTTSRDNLLNTLTSRRVLGQPYFVSEWDVPWPNEYRAEVTLLTAAAGAMQGWGGFAIHTYRYHNEPTDKIGRDVVLGGSFYRGIFDSFNDPAKFGLFYHAALLFRRADVRESSQTVGLDPRDADNPYSTPTLPLLTEHCRAGFVLPGHEPGDARMVPPDTPVVSDAEGAVRSETGELFRDFSKGYGWIDSPRTKAIYGFVAKADTIALNGVKLTCETDFATIAMSSLTDDPIGKADNLLLTAVGRADNTDVKYNEEHTVQLDCGRGPILVQSIVADIEIETEVAGLEVKAIDPLGFVTWTVPAEYRDGLLRFRIGDKLPSLYYLIQAM
ncbi:MAG: hypothetical protein GF331_18120 [Chitinivibrionales bacterium]|nr:hypothetical protein [Chitinivibrionales bacterium]